MLNTEQQSILIETINYEIQNYLCPVVPKYQSFNNMHVKHRDNKILNLLCDLVVLNAYVLTNNNLKIESCWFNVLKHDSNYEYHKHNTLACVYYLKNCTSNGTLVLVDGVKKQLPCLDGTFQFISQNVMHCIPEYKGLDRYTVAFDLCSA